jgi:tripartite-type tricarboxylate transporter receptor subunit TctC
MPAIEVEADSRETRPVPPHLTQRRHHACFAAIVKAVAKPEIKKLFEEQGVEGAASPQAEVAKMLQEDFVRLGELARSIGVHVE